MFVVRNKNGSTINNNWHKLEIISEGNMFFLLTYQDEMIGDSCYFSLNEAMSAASEVFGIHECDWIEMPDEEK